MDTPETAGSRGRAMRPGRKAKLFVAAVGCLALACVTASGWPETGLTRRAIVGAGILAILAAVAGRTWCSRTIGGRKHAVLVALGPYSLTRNPLYGFSILAAVGMAAQGGSLLLSCTAGIAVTIVFSGVVRDEEQALIFKFGQPYRDYLARVPRWFPNLRLWRSAVGLEVSAARVVTTFLDGLFFLLAIPMARAISWLQDVAILPVLARLP